MVDGFRRRCINDFLQMVPRCLVWLQVLDNWAVTQAVCQLVMLGFYQVLLQEKQTRNGAHNKKKPFCEIECTRNRAISRVQTWEGDTDLGGWGYRSGDEMHTLRSKLLKC